MSSQIKQAKIRIQKIFKQYSFEDICYSLFILSNWLPNISSTIKPMFLYLCLLEIYDFDWCSENKIRNYQDFQKFYNKIRILIPNFYSMEDYIPEQDWGDVYYFINDKCYKYLYGGELENTYDHLKFFELYHCALKDKLQNISGQDIQKDFIGILNLQEYIIDNIPNELTKISLRDFKIPNEDFWNKCYLFLYSKLNLLEIFDSKTLDWYSQTESISKNILQEQNFVSAVLSGKALNKLFIKKDNKYYILPIRRFAAVLLDIWNNIISENIEILEPAHVFLKNSLFDYIKNKVPPNYAYYRDVSILDENKNNFNTDALVVYDNKILFLIFEDFSIQEPYEDYLKNINSQIKSVKDFLENNKYIELVKNNHIERIREEDFYTKNIEIKFLIVHPSLSTSLNMIAFEYKPEFLLCPFVDFLQIIDNFKTLDDLFKTLEFIENIDRTGFSSLSDWLAYYMKNEGELLTGYRKYSKLFLEPSLGSNTRYEQLKCFWNISPKNTINEIAPYNWEMEQMEHSNSVEMYSVRHKMMAICCKFAQTEVFINSFYGIDSDLIKAIKFFAEIIEDIFNIHKKNIEKHAFFKTHNKLQILVISYEMIRKNNINEWENYTYNDNTWTIQTVKFKNEFGLRIIFNESKLYEQIQNTTNRKLVNELFIDIINKINQRFPDNNNLSILIEQAKIDKNKPTRFMVNSIKKETCFPEYHSVIYPKDSDFIRVQNTIAKILHDNNIKEGQYSLDEAKRIIDLLKLKLIEILDNEINTCDFIQSIPLLITYNDANTNDFEMKDRRIRLSLNHEVDFSREENLAEAHEKFLREAKNYRYLIEKFVQLTPSGEKALDENLLSYLLALVDWILVMYQNSNVIYYNLLASGLIIKEDKTIETVFLDDTAQQEDIYSLLEVKEELYSNPTDINFTSIMNDYENLCKEFKKDFGFNFQSMINLLTILSQWSNEELCYIVANESDIVNKMKTTLKDFTKEEEDEIPIILEFLTLKKEEVSTIIDKNDSSKTFQCKDIPVDEFNLRYSRYAIKPLIKYQNAYIFGAYSAQKTGKTFCNHLSNTRLPYKPQKENTLDFLNNLKKIHEKELVVNAYNIVKKHTNYVEKEVELYKRDKYGNHPKEIGDYDVLAYMQDKNILLNIECKHHLPAYCAKDARKYLDKMYEKDKNGLSAIDRVINREQYAINNYKSILKVLNVTCETSPKIISIYVSKIRTYYIMFPKDKTNIKMLSINDLENYLKRLKQDA